MKKTIPISIAQTLFYVEEPAYQKLEDYLREVKKYFSTYDDSAEIIQDIESRIREQFLQFCQEDKTERIITEEHIGRLTKTMGWPEEFGEFEKERPEPSAQEKKEKGPKRLYRDKDNAIIGGVASGIAVYFGIDPLIVRVAFFLSIFLNGIGILGYIFLWFAVPRAETATQKLEMHGGTVTLEEIRKIVDEKISEIGGREKVKTGIRNFFEELRNFLVVLGRTIFSFLGIIFEVAIKIALWGIVLILLLISIILATGSADKYIERFCSKTQFYDPEHEKIAREFCDFQ